MKPWIKILSFLMVLFVFTGCYAIEVKYNPDGSGRLTYIPPKDDPQPLDIREIKKSIAEFNQKTGKEVVKFLSFKRNQDHLEYIVSFTKISYLFENGELYFGSLQQLLREKPGIIKSVRNRNGKLIRLDQIDPKLLVAFHHDHFLDRIRVQVPGKVLYVSEAAKIINRSTVEITNEFGFVIFKKNDYFIWVLALTLITSMFAGVFYNRKNQRRT